MNIHLAKALVKENIISLDQVRAAIEEQRQTKKGLGEILVSLGYIDETQLLDFLSKEYGVPAANLEEFEIETAVLKLVPRKTVVEHEVLPIGLSGGSLLVAMSDPSNIIAVDDLRFATGYSIKPVVASESAIRSAIDKHYGTNKEAKNRIKAERSEEPIEEILEELEDFKRNIGVSHGSPSFKTEEKEVLNLTIASWQDDDLFPEHEEAAAETDQSTTIDPFSSPLSVHDRDSTKTELTSGEQVWEPHRFTSQEQRQEQGEEISFTGKEISEEHESRDLKSESGARSEEEKTWLDPSDVPGDYKGLSNTHETVEAQSSEAENILALFSPLLPSQDSESSVAHNEANSVEDDMLDQNSFFSQIYGNWEKQAETNPLPGHEQKVSEFASAAETPEDVHFNQSEDFAAKEEDNPPATMFYRDYESKQEHEEIVSESVSQDKVVDPFEPTSYSQESHSSSAEELPGESSNGAEKRESDEFSGFGASPFVTPSSRSVEEEKEPTDETVVRPHTETVTQSEREKEDSSQTTILVVDDSPTVQKIVAITLERKGYQVFTAANAIQALAKLNEMVPDLIFLDINLPHMDGYKLCKVIKDNGPTKDIPVVMLSGKDGFFDEVRGKMVGAEDHITKPFEPNTLIQSVEKHRRLRT